ncbi:MAG: hypothetical protein COA94_07500 [Rickettsiales bacterium]|nr:MAG: hypothetical protein COA94_07500 [Rickettsiales bacterium]
MSATRKPDLSAASSGNSGSTTIDSEVATVLGELIISTQATFASLSMLNHNITVSSGGAVTVNGEFSVKNTLIILIEEGGSFSFKGSNITFLNDATLNYEKKCSDGTTTLIGTLNRENTHDENLITLTSDGMTLALDEDYALLTSGESSSQNDQESAQLSGASGAPEDESDAL